jgi:hypothetical protein
VTIEIISAENEIRAAKPAFVFAAAQRPAISPVSRQSERSALPLIVICTKLGLRDVIVKPLDVAFNDIGFITPYKSGPSK